MEWGGGDKKWTLAYKWNECESLLLEGGNLIKIHNVEVEGTTQKGRQHREPEGVFKLN